MTTITRDAVGAADTAIDADAAVTPGRRGVGFWVTRYLPAEIVGTASMVVAGLLVTLWTDNPALIALAALLGEIVGFYVVLALTVYIEQSPIARTRRAAVARTAMLLVAEFGAAELLDTLLIRPFALLAGVSLFADPMWGLLVGKIVADIIFYAFAAGAFTLTAKAGLRSGAHRTGAAARSTASAEGGVT